MTDAGSLLPGKQLPSIVLKTSAGPVDLWSFRQRSHVLIINELLPEEKGKQFREELRNSREKVEWLAVTFLFVSEVHDALPAGAVLVDRWGAYVCMVPMGEEFWARLEKEILYYEAQHC